MIGTETWLYALHIRLMYVHWGSWLSSSGLILCAWCLCYHSGLANGWGGGQCQLHNSGFWEASIDILIGLQKWHFAPSIGVIFDRPAYLVKLKMIGKCRKMAENNAIFHDLKPILWVLVPEYLYRNKVGWVTWYILKPGYMCFILGPFFLGWGPWLSSSGLILCVWCLCCHSGLAKGWGGGQCELHNSGFWEVSIDIVMDLQT